MDSFWLGIFIGILGGLIGNALEALVTRHYAILTVRKTTAQVRKEIIDLLSSPEIQPAVDQLMARIQESPKALEIANNFGGSVVEGAADAVTARIKGTVGGLRKAVNAAEAEVEQAALAEQSPIFALAARALEGSKTKKKGGMGMADAIKAYAAMQAQGMPSAPMPAAAPRGVSTW